MVAVTVSREYGAGGTHIGTELAERLGARYLDREIIDMALQIAGVPAAVPAQTRPEEAAPVVGRPEMPGLARRIADAIRAPLESGLKPWPRHGPIRPGGVGAEDSLLRQVVPDDASYVDLMRSVLERVVDENPRVVIVGRGGMCALGGRPGVLNVHICGAITDRVARAARTDSVTESEAARIIRASDEERDRYIRRYYGVDWREPTLYHLVLNTSWLSDAQVLDLIMRAAEMV